MKPLKHTSLILAILFFTLWIANVIIVKNGYILRLQGYTSLHLSWLFFSLSGMFSYSYLMTISQKKMRIAETSFAIMCAMFLGFFLLWGSTPKEFYRVEEHEVISEENMFLFSGYITFYEKENFFVSKWVGSCMKSDNNSCTYTIEENKLIITERWYKYQEDDYIIIEEIKLKER